MKSSYKISFFLLYLHLTNGNESDVHGMDFTPLDQRDIVAPNDTGWNLGDVIEEEERWPLLRNHTARLRSYSAQYRATQRAVRGRGERGWVLEYLDSIDDMCMMS